MIFICTLVIFYFFPIDVNFNYLFLQFSQGKTFFDPLMPCKIENGKKMEKMRCQIVRSQISINTILVSINITLELVPMMQIPNT